MKPLGVTGRKEAAAVADTHVRAMAAANMDQSLPRNARRYEGLTKVPREARLHTSPPFEPDLRSRLFPQYTGEHPFC
jgi:hypothetical protein